VYFILLYVSEQCSQITACNGFDVALCCKTIIWSAMGLRWISTLLYHRSHLVTSCLATAIVLFSG